MQKSMYRTSEVEFARCPFCRNIIFQGTSEAENEKKVYVLTL